jgi:hypothetical protein
MQSNILTSSPVPSGAATPPWQDREVSRGKKLLASLLMVVVIFYCLFALSGAYFMYDPSASLAGPWAEIAIGFGVAILLSVRYISAPLKYKPRGAVIAADQPGQPFSVMFQYKLFTTTMKGFGMVRFLENEIEIDGDMLSAEPSQWGAVVFVVAVLLAVSGVFKDMLVVSTVGSFLGLLIVAATQIGKRPVFLKLPYKTLTVMATGRTISAQNYHAEPYALKFRLGTDDGERFYRELALHVPSTVASFKV